MINESKHSEAESNTSQEVISNRFLSIGVRVKGMLTPSEDTVNKLKKALLLTVALSVVIAINCLSMAILVTLFFLDTFGIVLSTLLFIPTMYYSIYHSLTLFMACTVSGISLLDILYSSNQRH